MAIDNPTGRAMLAAARKHVADAPFLHIDVPEWPDAEGKPSRIWYRATMPLNESFDINRWKIDQNDPRYGHAYCIIRRALDEQGNNLFNIGDEAALLEMDADVILRLSTTLISRPKVADAKKGSETTPTA